MRMRSARVTLTLWYVAAMVAVLAVYAASVFVFVSTGVWKSLDDRLHGDFLWAAEMADQSPDGTLAWFEGDSPWLQVWTPSHHLIYRSALASRVPIEQSESLASRADEQMMSVREPLYRILSAGWSIGGKPVIIQVARSEVPERREIRQLFLILVLGLPLSIAAAGFGGYFLARRALDQMQRFAANVSHELRTPLTVIRSVGEVGLRGRRDENGYRGIITSILEEVDRLTCLVDRILALSHAEAGQSRLAFETIDLGELAEEVASHLGVLAEEKRQSLNVDRTGRVQCVGDRMVLRQALLNLVDNAIKYTPPEGRIRIHVAASGSRAVLDVSDTGPGIGAEPRKMVFDRFYRGDPRSGGAAGAGLGLSIARWGVEVHGGRLTLEPTAGTGSLFRISLRAAGIVVAVLASAAVMSGCRGAQAIPFKPVADVKGLMQSVVDPQADIVWQSVATIYDAEGTHEVVPKTADQWTAVRNAAINLAESGNLLMMAPRAKDGGDWMKYSRDLVDISESAIRAAEAKDAARIYEIGGDINEKCMQCHQNYDEAVLRDLGKLK